MFNVDAASIEFSLERYGIKYTWLGIGKDYGSDQNTLFHHQKNDSKCPKISQKMY